MKEKSLNCREIYLEIIEDYADFISLSRSKEPIWPVHHESAAWYASPYYTRILLETFRKLKKTHSMEEIAKLWRSPTRLMYSRVFLCFGQHSGLSKEEMIELMEYVVTCYCLLKSGDPVNKNKQHIVWSNEKLEKEVKAAPFLKTNLPEEKRVVGKLELNLYYLLELVYFYHHARGHEVHGLYESKGDKILAREYFDVRVPYFGFAKKIPFGELTVLEKTKGLDVEIDLVQHIYSKESIPSKVTEISVERDGKYLKSISEIEDLSKHLSDVIELALEEDKTYSEKDWFKKCVEAYYWSLKPLRDEMEEDWRPPKEQYAFIEKGGHPQPSFAVSHLKPEEIRQRILEKYDLFA